MAPRWLGVATDLRQNNEPATIPGSAFGSEDEGYTRLTYSVAPETIETACDRLEEFATTR